MAALTSDFAPATIVRVERTIPIRRERVWRYWTDPELFCQWFGPPIGSTLGAELDVRVGGSFLVTCKPPLGPVFQVLGSYLEVEPPDRLAYSFHWQRMPVDPGEGRVTVELHERGEETEVVVTHALVRGHASRAFHQLGWSTSLRRLRRLA